MTAALDPHELNVQSMTYYYALEFGLVQVSEVMAWADQLILQIENPTDQLIKFALLGSSPASVVAEKMPFFDDVCAYDDELVFRRIIEIMVQKMLSNCLNVPTVSHVLSQLAGRHMIDEIVPKNPWLTSSWAYETSDKLREATFEKTAGIMNSVQNRFQNWLDCKDGAA